MEVQPPTDRQRQARALGDPTRHRIFEIIAGESRALSVTELTAHFDFNHNAIRQHLAILRDAGLVNEERQSRNVPGRPKLVYRVSASPARAGGVDGPYEQLAGLLVDVVSTGQSPQEIGRMESRRLAEQSDDANTKTSEGVIEVIVQDTARRGFEPSLEDGPRQIAVVFNNCPYAAAAAKDPATVCAIHLGLSEGVAEQLGHVRVESLIPLDPHEAGCRLHLSKVAPSPLTED